MDKCTIISSQKMSTNSYTKSAPCISLALFWQCRNPSFGLATKAKGLQSAGLIVDPGVQLCERKTLSVNEDIDLFF
jgi:hypothetical protein